jgi:hypothetical protein
MSSSKFVAVLLAVIGIAATAATASGQTGGASLTGIVTDQSASPVPGATVTATNQATSVP